MSSWTIHYQYQPLPTPTSIRLIQLQVEPGSEGISCKFEIVNLEDEPDYVALSYFWGDTSILHPVNCNAGVVMVTSAVKTMLQSLCDMGGRLWCDALCINQTDISERNQQVSIMADIYSKATNVTVWLGSQSVLSDAEMLSDAFSKLLDTLTFIDTIGATFDGVNLTNMKLQATLRNGRNMDVSLPSEIFGPDLFEQSRLKKFFNLPWFSRTWVIQEVGLAQSVELLCGETEFNWESIGIAAMFLIRYGNSLLQRIGILDSVTGVYHIYTAYSSLTSMKTFSHLLDNSRRFKALDPRDKVFAFLSHPTASTVSFIPSSSQNRERDERYRRLAMQFLSSADQMALRAQDMRGSQRSSHSGDNATTTSNRIRITNPLIKADYSKTTAEVYQELAVSHIQRTDSLEILTAVQHDPSLTTLPTPSWVPQWDKYVPTSTLGRYTSEHIASANRRPAFTSPMPSNPRTITVKGTIFSSVVWTSSLAQPADFDLPTSSSSSEPNLPSTTTNAMQPSRVAENPVIKVWFDLGLNRLYEAGELYAQTFRVLLKDESGTSYGIPSRHTFANAYFNTWVAGESQPGLERSDAEEDGFRYWLRLKSRNALADEEQVVIAAERYRTALVKHASYRKFFLIKKALFGLGPGAMKEGDWLVILYGADVPFIIREVEPSVIPEGQSFPAYGTKFQLVGECFCFGLMAGEGVGGPEFDRDIVLV